MVSVLFDYAGVLSEIERRYTKKDAVVARFSLMAKEKDFSFRCLQKPLMRRQHLEGMKIVVVEGVASRKDDEDPCRALLI